MSAAPAGPTRYAGRTMATLDELAPEFVPRLVTSARDTWIVAQWLVDTLKQNVIVRAIHIRPSADVRAEYSDQGDLEILQVVEVKRDWKRAFTSAADYPFPAMLVDNVASYERKRTKPYAYVVLNADATYAGIVKPQQSRTYWERRTIYNNGDPASYAKDVFCCPVAYVEFVRLPGVSNHDRPPTPPTADYRRAHVAPGVDC
jgi:hypothetical protein